jgi:fructose-bisphosphate aldolase class II
VDNSDIENSKLYTQPEDVAYAFKELSKVGKCLLLLPHSEMCTAVYKPGNVELRP